MKAQIRFKLSIFEPVFEISFAYKKQQHVITFQISKLRLIQELFKSYDFYVSKFTSIELTSLTSLIV